MEQSGAAGPPPQRAPQEPIVVLSKQNDYFFVGHTVEQVVANVRLHLSPDSGGGQGAEGSKAPGLDELDFFDSAGQQLEPVGGWWGGGLVVREPVATASHDEIYGRILVASLTIRLGVTSPRELVKETGFAASRSCSWEDMMLGRC